MQPFAASPGGMAQLGQVHLRPDGQMRPAYNVLALVPLEGSPYVISGDGKGCISAWTVALGKSVEEPHHYFEAHTGAICQMLPLVSGRLSELLEEREWQEEPAAPAARAARRRYGLAQDHAGAAPGDGAGGSTGSGAGVAAAPRDGAAEGDKVSLVAAGPQPRPRRRGLLQRLCCCCCGKKSGPPKAAPRGRAHARHWLIATAAEDGAVRIWRWRVAQGPRRSGDAPVFDVEFVAEWLSEKETPLTACLELPDGMLAVSLKDNADVLLVDPCTATLSWVLFGHTAAVSCLALASDGRLVSGGADGAVRLWAQRAWAGRQEATGAAMTTSATEKFGEDRPGPAAVVWGEPGQGRERAKAGVSSMAFFAHMQQAERSECVALCLRILVHRAEHLPKGDILSQSDPYVVCTVVEGDPSLATTVRTLAKPPVKASVTWEHHCTLGLNRTLVDGVWQLPECSELDFEVFTEWLAGGEPQLFAHCGVPMGEALAEAAKAKGPQAYKLYAPLGQGPYQDLQAAVLNVAFARNEGQTIGCSILSADGLPPLGLGARVFVRVTVRQSMTSKATARRVPARLKDRTKVITDNPNPHWNEVLELEVPVALRERHILQGPHVHLFFEVWDYDSPDKSDLLGTLCLPLSEVLRLDGGEIVPFNLKLAPIFEPKKAWRGKGGTAPAAAASHKEATPGHGGAAAGGTGAAASGLRGAASAAGDGARPPGAGEAAMPGGGHALATLPRIHLGFLALVPCPMQLRCTIERASALPLPRSQEPSRRPRPLVRARFVEGHPALPRLTAVRTGTRRRTLNPVWNERCVLQVPQWLINEAEGPPPELRPASVRAGWEHERRGSALDVVICVDIFDRDIISADDFLGRATVSFPVAWAAAHVEGEGRGRTRAVALSTDPSATLTLGFEEGPQPDQIVVFIERAHRLPVGDSSGYSDPYCVVRIAELGSFGEPTDRAEVRLATAAYTEPAPPGVRDPTWGHEAVLDLPGGEIGGVVAARPHWHLLFEVIDANASPDEKEPVLAQASVSLTELLSGLRSKEKEGPAPTQAALRKRLHELRAPPTPTPVTRQAAVSSAFVPDAADEEEPIRVTRELPLLVPGKRDALRRGVSVLPQHAGGLHALQEALGLGDTFGSGGSSGASSRPHTPSPVRSNSRPGTPQQRASASHPSTPSTSRPGTPSSSGTGLAAAPPPPLSPRAQDEFLRTSLTEIGRQLSVEVGPALGAIAPGADRDGQGGKSVLVVRFEAVPRWGGAARGAKRPPTKHMPGPSPVTCLATLVSSIVSGHEDGNVFVWDTTGCSPRPLHHFSAHRAPISCMAVYPPLDLVVTGGGARTRGEALSDSVLRAWSCTTFELQHAFPLHGAVPRVVLGLEAPEEGKRSAGLVPCLALSTDTRQSRILQLLRVEAPGSAQDG